MISGDDTIHISEVKHMTYLKVDEAGTEAAAATTIGIETTSTMIDDLFEIKFDESFFLLVVDETIGAILFIGDIYDVS